METRDGTPFMGLTTHDDGIPSIDGKTNKQTTNKRCNNCLKIKCTCNFIHFHPYSSSQFIFIDLTHFIGAQVASTNQTSAPAKLPLFKNAKTAFTSPPLRSVIVSTEGRQDISTATGIERIGEQLYLSACAIIGAPFFGQPNARVVSQKSL